MRMYKTLQGLWVIRLFRPTLHVSVLCTKYSIIIIWAYSPRVYILIQCFVSILLKIIYYIFLLTQQTEETCNANREVGIFSLSVCVHLLPLYTSCIFF